MATESKTQLSSGVQALIDRLKEQGVEAGKQQAENIIAEAQSRADWIVQQAQQEAQQIKQQAEQEANFIRQAGQDSLRMAYRDAILELKNTLTGRFVEQVQALVAKELNEEEVIKQMLIEIACLNSLDEQPSTLILPRHQVGIEELRDDPEKLTSGVLAQFVSQEAKRLLEKGIEIRTEDGQGAGFRIELKDQRVVMDFSQAAISELLLKHLQPRFKVLLEGLVG